MRKITLSLTIIAIIISVSCNKSEFTKLDNVNTTIDINSLLKLYKDAVITSRQKAIKLSSLNPNVQINLVNPNDPNYPPAPPVTYDEPTAISIVRPLINPTATYILQKYDIDVYDYFSPGDPRIAEVGYAAMRIEQLEADGMTIDTNFYDPGNIQVSGFKNIKTNLVDTNDPNVYDCALRAVGISAVVELFQSGITGAAKSVIARKALRKAITKIASRSLGFIGAAIAIYEFGDCMEAW